MNIIGLESTGAPREGQLVAHNDKTIPDKNMLRYKPVLRIRQRCASPSHSLQPGRHRALSFSHIKTGVVEMRRSTVLLSVLPCHERSSALAYDKPLQKQTAME
jgi:hypothetical protein